MSLASHVAPTGSVTIAGLTFTSSSLSNAGTLTLINSTISGNTALFFPVIHRCISRRTLMVAASSTMWEGSSPSSTARSREIGLMGVVAASYNSPSATLTLINSTVSRNLADSWWWHHQRWWDTHADQQHDLR